MAEKEELKQIEEIETLHFVNKRIKEEDEEEEEQTFGDDSDSSFQNLIDSREFRCGFVSIILLVWSGLMIPYDINGSVIHGGYVFDRDMFISSLYIWLIGHLSVMISSILSLIILFINIKSLILLSWIINIELLLIMTSSCLQVLGSILFAYSYCVNTTESDNNSLWASCVCKCHGLYLLYNSGFITYFGFIIFASKYNGSIPLISLFIDKNCCIDRGHIDDDNPIKFNKNFRVSFLSIVSFIGMILILVFGFDTYRDVGDSYQAIYIGYTFMLIATFILIISQLTFHCNYCNKRRGIRNTSNISVSNANIVENTTTTTTTTIHQRKFKNYKKKKSKKNMEKVVHLAVYFLIYAGIVLIFMYSLVSKIPEASNVVERVRLIGNMIIITGTGIIITYELYTNDDNYDDQYIHHQYNIIPDHDQELHPQ